MEFVVEALSDWFAVQVWTGREQSCAHHLRLRGYEVLLPTYSEQRRWSDRVKRVTQPLFAGYVFCRIRAEITSKVVTTPGVIRIVGDARGAVPIAASEALAIQRIVEQQFSAEPCAMPQTGQRIRVEVGPLRGLEGTVLMVRNSHRLVVSVSLLQRALAVEVDREWIGLTEDDACPIARSS